MRKSTEIRLRHGLYHLQDVENPTYITGLFHDVRCLEKESAEQSLRVVRTAFEQILRNQQSNLNFEELYRFGYYLVLHGYGRLLYSTVRSVISDHVSLKLLPKILNSLDYTFLHTVICSWKNLHSSILVISDAMMYLDRMYVNQTRFDDVYALGLDLFKNFIVYHMDVQLHLQNTLLQLAMLERRGQVVDRVSFRCATQMLMVLGIKSSELYKEVFEEPFLIQSAEYFREESQKLLEVQSVSLYLRRVKDILSDEIERADVCFDKITTPRLIKVADHELIQMQVGTMIGMRNSGVVYMMDNQQIADLSCMYDLLGRVPGGHDAMFSCTSRYIRDKGEELNKPVGGHNNAVAYVDRLMGLKDYFDYFLIHSFSLDKHFKKSIASDFEYVINQNPKSPEYLSLFIDEKLRKAAKGLSEDSKNELFQKVIVFFRFLQDKDLFQQYYKQHLAKRLLTGKGIDEESERDLISKFKNECGHHYTRKMEGMFRDMSSSCNITEEFHKYVSETGDSGVDISVRVLTASYWPKQSTPCPCILPSAPLIALETFKEFYQQRHCGRQLTLMPQLSSAELETYFVQTLCQDGEGWHTAQTQPCGETRSYTLQVSTYQMCILMLFNDRPHWNFQDLLVGTNIVDKDLRKALQPLFMGKPTQKVLIKHPDSHEIDFNDLFFVNTAFTSKSNKVKIPPAPVKYETYFDNFEKEDTMKRVKNNRYEELEAAIVRIMKSNKMMNHETLVTEVTNSLKQRFMPSKDSIKCRIEVLIEREYLCRHPDDKRVYLYVPS